MDTYFEILIKIGRCGTLPKTEELINNNLTQRIYLSGNWIILSDDNLINLFKGLVVLEEYWCKKGEKIGSTTDTKFVYHEMLKRHLDDDYSIGNWAFEYSSNSYVPLETGNRHGAKTIYDYFNWQSNLDEKKSREKIDATIRREEKKRLKAEAHAERLKKKEIRDRELGYKK